MNRSFSIAASVLSVSSVVKLPDSNQWNSTFGGFARELRVEYPGAILDVVNRGVRREPIFRNDEDCQKFLVTIGEIRVKTGW